jgi:hypothetical protein
VSLCKIVASLIYFSGANAVPISLLRTPSVLSRGSVFDNFTRKNLKSGLSTQTIVPDATSMTSIQEGNDEAKDNTAAAGSGGSIGSTGSGGGGIGSIGSSGGSIGSVGSSGGSIGSDLTGLNTRGRKSSLPALVLAPQSHAAECTAAAAATAAGAGTDVTDELAAVTSEPAGAGAGVGAGAGACVGAGAGVGAGASTKKRQSGITRNNSMADMAKSR